MKRPLLLVVPLLLVLVAPAQAGELRLSWDHCPGDQATWMKLFACDVNSGHQLVVGSFVPWEGITDITAMQAEIVVATDGYAYPLPDWWMVGPGSCRQNAYAASLVFEDLPQGSCTDPWQGAVTSFLTPSVTFPQLRLTIDGLMQGPVAVEANVEYYAFKLLISNKNSTGPDACAGCQGHAGIYFTNLTLVRADSTRVSVGPYYVPGILWQCTPKPDGSGCCDVMNCGVATRNRTWGQVKGLYR